MSLLVSRQKLLLLPRLCKVNKVSYRGAFFTRKKTPALTDEDVEKALGQPEHRKYQAEDGPLIKQNLNQLASKRVLTTKKGFKPPPDVEKKIENVVSQLCPGEKDWRRTSLKDPRVKYKVLSRLIQEFNHDIPNFKMSRMSTVDDAVQHFQTEIHETTAFEDLSRVDLPPNLHIQWEPVRFNPETDKMFGGRTAYPGQDNVVTSIKFRRKYETIKTTKEKPGYYNHYYDY